MSPLFGKPEASGCRLDQRETCLSGRQGSPRKEPFCFWVAPLLSQKDSIGVCLSDFVSCVMLEIFSTYSFIVQLLQSC